MKVEKDLRYAKTHEWIRIDGDTATVGITDFAQSELNDVVYVELPMSGEKLEQGERFGSVESVKAASDVYMPAGGEVLEVNKALEDNPALVNQQPYSDGWFIKIRLSDASQVDSLMTAEQYEQFSAQPSH